MIINTMPRDKFLPGFSAYRMSAMDLSTAIGHLDE